MRPAERRTRIIIGMKEKSMSPVSPGPEVDVEEEEVASATAIRAIVCKHYLFQPIPEEESASGGDPGGGGEAAGVAGAAPAQPAAPDDGRE
ncbi:hypothetical protein J437_LFUL005587, partial [Ladona fulva]